MGWSSANRIFDPIARALVDHDIPDATIRKVLGDLIAGLQAGDWDTEDESLEKLLDHPAVVQAFADCKVHLADRRCCLAEHAEASPADVEDDGPVDAGAVLRDLLTGQVGLAPGDADELLAAALAELIADADGAEVYPPRSRWRVETHDGLADEWAPGIPLTDRDAAHARRRALDESHPTWRDGTPVRRRVVCETTTWAEEKSDD